MYIGVCVVFLTENGGEAFPALTTSVNRIYNPPCRHSGHHIFLHSSNKNDTRHVGIQGQTTPVGSDFSLRVYVCSRWYCLFRFRLTDREFREVKFKFLDFGRGARNPNTSPVTANICLCPFPFSTTQHSILSIAS